MAAQSSKTRPLGWRPLCQVGHFVDADWKHVDVSVSQQSIEPAGAAGQVLWHCALEVQVAGQTASGLHAFASGPLTLPLQASRVMTTQL
jgi:hypothetical protein